MSQSNVRTFEKATDSARETANEAVKSASEGAARVGEKLLETYHNVRDRLQEHGAEAKEQASHLASQVKQQAGQVGAQVKEKASEVGEEIGAGYVRAKDKLSEGKESAIELFNDLIDQLAASSARVGGYVRNNPGKSFAAAALLGVIATRAMSKRTK